MTPSTLSPERAALVRAVCQAPEDDTVRLAFADWLEENGEEERAEFVRAMIAHPDLRRYCLSPVKVNQHSSRRCRKCDVCCAMDALRANFDEWTPDISCTVEIYGHAWSRGYYRGDAPVFRFVRGFVESVTCSQADFLAHVAPLFASHPIERVTLSDREPSRSRIEEDGNLVWCWWKPNHGVFQASASELAAELWESLVPRDGGYVVAWDRITVSDWESDSLALSALSAACVSYGRTRAGF